MSEAPFEDGLKQLMEMFFKESEYGRKLLEKTGIAVEGQDVIEVVKQVYEKIGIDLVKEAFYEYFERNGVLPPFYKSDEDVFPDLRTFYGDDPRLHSQTDQTLGEYIDDWRNKDVSDEERKWCKVSEDVRAGLDPKLQGEIVEQFVERVATLPEAPDVLTMMPSSDPSKSPDQYQMFPFASEIVAKTGTPFDFGLMRAIKERDRVEAFQGKDKYFGRRSALEGTIQINNDVLGKVILIMDDGWSSGASLDTVKKMLYEQGAKKVYSMHLVRC